MPSLQRITPEFLPELIEGMLYRLNPQMSRQGWQQAFTCPASTDEGYGGYALVDGGRIVGVQGMIFSRRTVGGQTAHLCNLHSWYVEPDYRPLSLLLMRPVLALRNHTITDFSASARVLVINKRLGFVHLDRSAWALWPHSARAECDATLDELSGPDDPLAAVLSDEDRAILADHQGIGCGHLLLRDAGGYCYLVYSRIDKTWLPYCYVHYVSNRQLFVVHDAALRAHLMQATGGRYVALDGRQFAPGALARSSRVRTKEAIYRPAAIEGALVDSLYSEMVYFKLSPVMTIKQRLARTARRCLPAPLLKLVGAAP